MSKNKSNSSFKWRDLFANKFFDLLIVITGVSIAFQLNNWKLQADQRAMERFYLENILVDLNKDVGEFERILADMDGDYRSINRYLSKKTVPYSPSDSLGTVVVETLGFETFSGNQDTYATLISGNGLSALEDAHIRSELAEYYKHYISIERFEKVYTELLYTLNDYFTPYCDYSRREIVDPSVAGKVQTRNSLVIARQELSGGKEDYIDILGRAKSLQASIKSMIEK
jgi:hypothetical protein